jgi:hypothetical protein
VSADRQRLQKLYAKLDDSGRHALLEYAEFLAARQPQTAEVPEQPRDLPRPDGESVIAALKRLRATYPMLDSAPLLDAAATLVTAHVLHGRSAVEVIDELEKLFGSAYAKCAAGDGAGS